MEKGADNGKKSPSQEKNSFQIYTCNVGIVENISRDGNASSMVFECDGICALFVSYERKKKDMKIANMH